MTRFWGNQSHGLTLLQRRHANKEWGRLTWCQQWYSQKTITRWGTGVEWWLLTLVSYVNIKLWTLCIMHWNVVWEVLPDVTQSWTSWMVNSGGGLWTKPFHVSTTRWTKWMTTQNICPGVLAEKPYNKICTFHTGTTGENLGKNQLF